MRKDNYRIEGQYVFFLGSFLSNWYPCSITYQGKYFRSSEQLFMYLKAMHFKDAKMATRILDAKTPEMAKAFGRQVRNYSNDEWKKYRYKYMKIALVNKFKCNDDLREMLISPEFDDKRFVEGNMFDRIWSCGLAWKQPGIENPDNWIGLNLLGQALNDIRMEFKIKQNINTLWDQKLSHK